MAWTNLINALFLPGKKILGATGMALRDNLIAVIEGLSGAPRIQPAAMVQFVSRSGLLTTHEVDFTYPTARIRASGWAAVGGSTAASFKIRASSNGGASWGSDSTLVNFSSDSTAEQVMFELEVDLLTGVFSFIYAGNIQGRNSGTMSVSTGTDALEFSINAGQFAITVYAVGTAT